MNTIEAIKTRKSVRSFKAQPVEREKIQAVVEAGAMAAGTPMAGKRRFIVITNAELLTMMSDATKRVMATLPNPMFQKMAANPDFCPTYKAPVAVVIVTDNAADDNSRAMLTANAACAGENMLLAATSLGLGSCYLVSPTMAFFNPAFCTAVGMPEGAHAEAVIVMGYTDDDKPHAPRANMDEMITFVE